MSGTTRQDRENSLAKLRRKISNTQVTIANLERKIAGIGSVPGHIINIPKESFIADMRPRREVYKLHDGSAISLNDFTELLQRYADPELLAHDLHQEATADKTQVTFSYDGATRLEFAYTSRETPEEFKARIMSAINYEHSRLPASYEDPDLVSRKRELAKQNQVLQKMLKGEAELLAMLGLPIPANEREKVRSDMLAKRAQLLASLTPEQRALLEYR